PAEKATDQGCVRLPVSLAYFLNDSLLAQLLDLRFVIAERGHERIGILAKTRGWTRRNALTIEQNWARKNPQSLAVRMVNGLQATRTCEIRVVQRLRQGEHRRGRKFA